jgi:hypothetical protein
MNRIGKGIAMAGLALSAAWLEVSGNEASGLWLILVLWIVFADWGQTDSECKCVDKK